MLASYLCIHTPTHLPIQLRGCGLDVTSGFCLTPRLCDHTRCCCANPVVASPGPLGTFFHVLNGAYLPRTDVPSFVLDGLLEYSKHSVPMNASPELGKS